MSHSEMQLVRRRHQAAVKKPAPEMMKKWIKKSATPAQRKVLMCSENTAFAQANVE